MKKNKYLFINITIIFALTISSFCYIHYNKDSSIYSRNINKVVEVRASYDQEIWIYSTGFFIDSKGSILTNKHAVVSSKELGICNYIEIRQNYEVEWEQAKFIRESEDNDLALLQINETNKSYFSFANKYKSGQSIYTIGNPNGFGLSFSKGNISAKSRDVLYDNKRINAMQTSLVINEGNSGGPVFKSNDKLVGIVSFRLKDKQGEVIHGISFIIPIENIKEFIYQ